MIVIKRKKVVDVPRSDAKVLGVFVRGHQVWPDIIIDPDDDLIHSCFARGYWINEEPWTDNYGWKNN